MKREKLIIDGKSLTLEQIEFFLKNNPEVALSKEAKASVAKGRKLIDKWTSEDEVIYGVTTGFGEFANVKISQSDIETLQENLIKSHSVGAGDPLPPFIIKTMMLLRANALAKGHSGIRLETLELLLKMMNLNIIPFIPSRGSVGSSGDLAPLAHLTLAMIGMGEAQKFENIWENFEKKKVKPSGRLLRKYGLNPIRLKAKEGLALINGTQMMTAFASYICIRAKKLIKIADIAAALSHEALRGTDKAYDLRLHRLRPYKGQIQSAKNMLSLIKNSEIRKSHLKNDPRVQDSYSIRCIPQIHGASRDAVEFVCKQISTELNSVTDNPLIFPDDGDHLEGGNFHGQPVALVLDFMKIALAELANVSERRIERCVNGSLSGLPRFLTPKGGLNSGLMIAQYTAASLVSENKTLAHPASVDSIPTSANQEDHNSMGSIAALHCYQILKNVETVLAIELLTASQGLEFLKPLKPGKGTATAYNLIRSKIKPLVRDRVLHDDVQKALELIRSDALLNEVESKIKLD
jgi:histidine ammonia-lyase